MLMFKIEQISSDVMMPETKEWYDMAVVDLGVAKHLEDTYYPKPLEIICCHCQ